MKLKSIFFVGVFLCSVGLMTAQAPANYYNGTTGLTGSALKTKLSQIIDVALDKGYSGLWTAYQTTDRDYYYENNGKVLDMYSERPTAADPYEYTIVTNQCGNYQTEGDCYNREHLVPQSLFNSANPMHNDVHFIPPTDGKVNGMRSDWPFGKVSNPTWTSLNGSKLGQSATSGYSGTVFEPIDEFKGDIARMIFYFVTRYENKLANFSSGNMLGNTAFPGLQTWELNVLLLWNDMDPVSQREIDRNNAAYTWQNNRNPYIDNPQWVHDVWGYSTLSANDVVKDTAVLYSLYPNPAKDIISLSGRDIAKIEKLEIYNSLGQLIKKNNLPFKNTNTVDVKDLKPGVYYFVTERFSTKFIKE
ncbi:endonuclease [Chryseobacterium sp. PET-29]|uniref:endonuclease n=1 Tax=Chryseobacterium sp. PET-29 TaxID=2983267 RepID=UPI0021E5BD12|nr:endonuclease [Chryseobacterium sp. PET-29]